MQLTTREREHFQDHFTGVIHIGCCRESLTISADRARESERT